LLPLNGFDERGIMSISRIILQNIRGSPWAWASWPPDVNSKDDMKEVLEAITLGRLDEIGLIENMSKERNKAEYCGTGFAGLMTMFSLMDFIGNFYNSNASCNNPNDDIEKFIKSELGKIDHRYSKYSKKLIELRNYVVHNQHVCEGVRLWSGDNRKKHLSQEDNEMLLFLLHFKQDIEKAIFEYIRSIDDNDFDNIKKIYVVLKDNGNLPYKNSKSDVCKCRKRLERQQAAALRIPCRVQLNARKRL
jgi:hypothetical protein